MTMNVVATVPTEQFVGSLVEQDHDKILEVFQAVELMIGDWEFTREVLLWAAELENAFRTDFPEADFYHFLMTGEMARPVEPSNGWLLGVD